MELPWNVWLGLASGALLVVGLVLAMLNRGVEDEDFRVQPLRRHPMPLYEEGATS